MKIAILSHMHHPIAEPFEGGTEAHTALLADALADRGHDVTLFAKAGSVSRATVYPLVPSDFEFVYAASRLVREEQAGFLAEAVHHSIEVIQSSGFDAVINNSLSALPYSFMRHLPMLSILHTPPTLRDVNAVISDPDWVPSKQHAYVTVSATNADAWRALLPRVLVVHNGIHLDRWTPDRAPVPGLAVWAARITPEKGLHCAIDAARSAGFDIEFAGPVSHPEYFETEIVPRLGAHVRYRGHIPHSQLSDFLASGSVFVASPLWAEPFGLSGVEALASGTPVAAFPNGALPELVVSGAGAIAADVTVAALADAIRDAAQCDRAFTRRSAARFSFDAMIDRYEEHLQLLVAMERTPSTVGD
ncbi:glycosyltransferase involved in cell wall biosynthesis [Salinibacterium sp. CAN_S4]|uniref:glycosyltransferase n=1 Tax=Salinibacterium sp. CAN_S4 TaxID=2787727 RepID=UPI0018F049C4